jgi:hypothetical protein
MQYEPAVMRFVIQAKVADVLAGESEGIPVAEIAKKTGIEQGKLARILRFLATRNCFREVRHEVFANSRLSLSLGSGAPLANIFLMGTNFFYVFVNKIHACLTDPDYGPSLVPEKSTFMYCVRDEGVRDFYDYLKHHPDDEQLFASGMVAKSAMAGNNVSIVKDFPWKDIILGSTLCDVGSGVGAVSLDLAKAHPHLRITLQDQPQIIEWARDLWSREYPKALQEQRVAFLPLDFFREGPVKNQDVYYMRQIVHNWPDSLAIDILKNVKGSMKPDSRLLIHDYILHGSRQHDVSDSTDMATAPEPLLKNFGAGNIRPYAQDVNLMMLMNAKERSLDEFKALGIQAGLEFVRVWDIVESGIVEFKVAV